MRCPREKRHQRAANMEKVGEKNTPPSMARKESIHPIEPFRSKPKARAVAPQPIAAQPAPKLIANAVAHNRGQRDQPNEQSNIEDFLAGKKAGKHDHAFARHEKTKERLALKEHDQKNNQITPLLETEEQIVKLFDQCRHQFSKTRCCAASRNDFRLLVQRSGALFL